MAVLFYACAVFSGHLYGFIIRSTYFMYQISETIILGVWLMITEQPLSNPVVDEAVISHIVSAGKISLDMCAGSGERLEMLAPVD